MAETQNQTPPVQPPPTGPAQASGSPEKDARLWCMLCHLAIIVPCFPCVLTLIIWMIKKKEFPSVDVHGKRALNFQLSVFIVSFAIVIASVVLSFVHLGFIGLINWPIWLAAAVLGVIAGIKANNGENYEYPWSLKLIK
jgi:uncharacterized Tic20 family protein